MASKRTASYQLNDTNWDQEDTPEDAGTFTKASEDVLKKRVFKTAKRRIAQSAEGSADKNFNPTNFFLTSKESRPTGQLFGFLSNMKPDVKSNGAGSSEATNKGEQGNVGQSNTSAVFSFGAKRETKQNCPVLSTEKNGTAETNSTNLGPIFSFRKNIKDETMTTKADKSPSFNTDGVSHGKKSSDSEKQIRNLDDYYSKLKGLNQSVAKWINKHVEGNPLINLQPIFKDYEKFFDEIEKERDKSGLSATNSVEISQTNSAVVEAGKKLLSNFNASKPEEKVAEKSKFKFSVTSSDNAPASDSSVVSRNTVTSTESGDAQTSDSPPKFSFGNTSTDKLATSCAVNVQTSNASPKFNFGNTNPSKSEVTTSLANVPKSDSSSLFSFGNTNTAKFGVSTASSIVPTSDSTPKFSFGSTNTSGTGFSGFSFKPSTPINFGTIPTSTPVSNEESKNEEQSDEPPKLDVKQVEEEGHIYSIRCKLFVKKDANFVEKGIGSLFLKPVPNSDKIQLIVRAHNSLGNVLCNIILSKSIPTQRMGKNNVMIVCIPTPESLQQPVPVLIKVKTGEDADQLLETLEKHKK
ncbi:hypothetical protein WA026_016187 [Henosepilachna vigintioctopunctata]|uniref:RanBD1 domain-containing protein n=1 Tax=Henosepilachna vigintioctopunctata TaxID=420089 RepID=A0AAW1TMZ1_9CUCU